MLCGGGRNCCRGRAEQQRLCSLHSEVGQDDVATSAARISSPSVQNSCVAFAFVTSIYSVTPTQKRRRHSALLLATARHACIRKREEPKAGEEEEKEDPRAPLLKLELLHEEPVFSEGQLQPGNLDQVLHSGSLVALSNRHHRDRGGHGARCFDR